MKSDQVHQHAIDLDSLGSDTDGPIPMITTPKGVSVDVHPPSSSDTACLSSAAAAAAAAGGGVIPPQPPAASAGSSQSGDGCSDAKGSESKDENFIANALKSEVRLPKTEDEKKKFHNWLFKLANPKEQDRISEKELSTLLKALENDGITPDELVMDPSTDVERNAKEIIEEYGSSSDNGGSNGNDSGGGNDGNDGQDGNVGYLTEDQFLALAKCITDNYELTSLVNIINNYIIKLLINLIFI